jgi:hypothetical protein
MSNHKKSGATLLNAVTMTVVIMAFLVVIATVVGAVINEGLR